MAISLSSMRITFKPNNEGAVIINDATDAFVVAVAVADAALFRQFHFCFTYIFSIVDHKRLLNDRLRLTNPY